MATQERGIVTRAEILEAAGRVFSRLSFSEAKVSDVQAGITMGKGAIYFHFESKHGLARAVLEEGHSKLRDAGLDSLTGESDARSRLDALTGAVARLVAESPVVAGSLRLSAEAAREFPDLATNPYELLEPMIADVLTAANDGAELREGTDIGALAWVIAVTLMGSKERLVLDGELHLLPERVGAAMRCIGDAVFVSPEGRGAGALPRH